MGYIQHWLIHIRWNSLQGDLQERSFLRRQWYWVITRTFIPTTACLCNLKPVRFSGGDKWIYCILRNVSWFCIYGTQWFSHFFMFCRRNIMQKHLVLNYHFNIWKTKRCEGCVLWHLQLKMLNSFLLELQWRMSPCEYVGKTGRLCYFNSYVSFRSDKDFYSMTEIVVLLGLECRILLHCGLKTANNLFRFRSLSHS